MTTETQEETQATPQTVQQFRHQVRGLLSEAQGAFGPVFNLLDGKAGVSQGEQVHRLLQAATLTQEATQTAAAKATEAVQVLQAAHEFAATRDFAARQAEKGHPVPPEPVAEAADEDETDNEDEGSA